MQHIIIRFVASEIEKYPPQLGQIMTDMHLNTPDGFLPCDGRVLRQKNYPELCKIIKAKYGDVDGGNTAFKLPLMISGERSIRYIIYVGTSG